MQSKLKTLKFKFIYLILDLKLNNKSCCYIEKKNDFLSRFQV